MVKRPSTPFWLFWPVITWAAGAAVFFRDQVLSGFDRVMADAGDGRLIVLLHEHWVHVAAGRREWRSPNFFFPEQGVLGFSDTFFLNQLFYLPLRSAGVEKFLAFQLTLVLMSAVGFAAFYALVTRHLRAHQATACVGSLLFAFPNNLFLTGIHPQMFSVYWLPVVVFLVLEAVRPAAGPWRRTAAGGTGGLLLGLVAYSSFYVGFAAILALSVFAAALFFLAAGRMRHSARTWLSGIRTAGVAFFVGAAAALVPFLVTYLPVLAAAGPRDYAEVQQHAPHLRDVVNVSTANALWGGLIVRTFDDGRPFDNTEYSLAVTPLVVLTLCALALGVTRRRSPPRAMHEQVVLAIAATVIVLALVPVDFQSGSAWKAVRAVVPGATAIRAPDRIQIVSHFVAVMGIVMGLTLIVRSRVQLAQRKGLILSAAILGILCVEQLNAASVSFISVAAEVESLAAVPSAPRGCDSFALVDSVRRGRRWYVYQTDAMMIADAQDLPTVNGYSGQTPQGWDLRFVSARGYEKKLEAWLAYSQLEATCTYDVDRQEWDVATSSRHKRGAGVAKPKIASRNSHAPSS